MILKFALPAVVVLLFAGQSFAGVVATVKGQVLRIENSEAVIKSSSGEIRIPMKKLSKADTKTVLMASGKKKEIELKLSPQSLEKESP